MHDFGASRKIAQAIHGSLEDVGTFASAHKAETVELILKWRDTLEFPRGDST